MKEARKESGQEEKNKEEEEKEEEDKEESATRRRRLEAVMRSRIKTREKVKVSEVYSVRRVAPVAEEYGMQAGTSFDSRNGWDFTIKEQR